MFLALTFYIFNVFAFTFYRLGPTNAFGSHPKYLGNKRLKLLTAFIFLVLTITIGLDLEWMNVVYIFVCNFMGVFVISFVLKEIYTESDPKFWKRECYQSAMYSLYTTIWYTFKKYKINLARYLLLYLLVWTFMYVFELKQTKGIPMLVSLGELWGYILVWLLYSFFPLTAGTLVIYNILRKK